MVIFHHAAVYIHHKRLFKIILKIKKIAALYAVHTTFTQPVHFPQTDLRPLQQNFAVLFCSQFTLAWLCFRLLLPSTIEFC